MGTGCEASLPSLLTMIFESTKPARNGPGASGAISVDSLGLIDLQSSVRRCYIDKRTTFEISIVLATGRSTLKCSDTGLKVTFKPGSLNFRVLLRGPGVFWVI